jgi:hypothetical protein
LELAKQQGLYLPLLEASKRQYDQMVKIGLGDIDKSGISELTFKSRKADLFSSQESGAGSQEQLPTGDRA